MHRQKQTYGTSVGSVKGRFGLPDVLGVFQVQSNFNSPNSSIAQLRRNATENGANPNDKGSSSLGFLAVNLIVLGIIGYLFMTGDTVATTDTKGGFSFFKPDEEGTFAVKPGKRANWVDIEYGPSQNENRISSRAPRGGLSGLNTARADGNETDDEPGSSFLAPGQLEKLFKSQSPKGAWSAPVQNGRPTLGDALDGLARSNASEAAVFDSELLYSSRYRRYTGSKPQEAQALAAQTTIAIEDATNALNEHQVRILKGRLLGVSGQGGAKGAFLLRVAHGARPEVTTATVRLAEHDRASAHTFEIEWSSSTASYFYILDSGVTEGFSTRLTRILRPQKTARRNCKTPCKDDRLELSKMNAKEIADRLSAVARSGAFLTYLVQDHSQAASPKVIAILLQDLTERKWQVIHLKQHPA